MQFFNCNINKDEVVYREYVSVNIRTDDVSRNLIQQIEKSIKNFVNKWMTKEVQNQINLNFTNEDELLIDRVKQFLFLISNFYIFMKKKKKAKCCFCGITVEISQEKSNCDSCMNNYLISGKFAILKVKNKKYFSK